MNSLFCFERPRSEQPHENHILGGTKHLFACKPTSSAVPTPTCQSPLPAASSQPPAPTQPGARAGVTALRRRAAAVCGGEGKQQRELHAPRARPGGRRARGRRGALLRRGPHKGGAGGGAGQGAGRAGGTGLRGPGPLGSRRRHLLTPRRCGLPQPRTALPRPGQRPSPAAPWRSPSSTCPADGPPPAGERDGAGGGSGVGGG